MKVAEASLADVAIFRDLPAADLEALSQRCTWRRFDSDQQIVGHLDDTRDVHFIVRGKVRVIVYSFAGKEVTFRDIPAGELFGELSALDGQPRSANVVALEPSLTAALSNEVFNEIVDSHPKIAKALLLRLTQQVRGLTERIFQFSTLAVKNRIHAELLRLAEASCDDGNTAMITPVPKHAEMASRLSTHREAVTRELTQLAQNGLLERRKEGLFIRDLERLGRMVEEVQGV